MKTWVPIRFAATLACLAGFVLSPASAQQAAAPPPPPPPTITIEGAATATLAPDTATLSLGVVTTRAKASDAVAENSRALANALAAIKTQGILPDAITTTALELSAVTDEPKVGPPKVVGYRARNQIEVHIRTSTDIGALTATLIDKGINSVDDLRFSSSEEVATRERLRGEAAANARHEAEIYTSALGLRLGRVLGIKPEAAPGQPFRMQSGLVARIASAPVPVEAGRSSLTERVSVTFELAQ